MNKCTRCGKVWKTKKKLPKNCPSCNSPYWNREYVLPGLSWRFKTGGQEMPNIGPEPDWAVWYNLMVPCSLFDIIKKLHPQELEKIIRRGVDKINNAKKTKEPRQVLRIKVSTAFALYLRETSKDKIRKVLFKKFKEPEES